MDFVKILVVDDHPLMRDALCNAVNLEPDLKVVAEVSSGEEALAVFEELAADVIIMDLGLPGISGFEAIQEILRRDPDAKILVNTSMEDEERILAAVQAGALGYYPKTAPRAYLLEAIRKVADGVPYMPMGITKKLFQGIRKWQAPSDNPSPKTLLTDRQEEVLMLLAEGCSDAEIAASLSLSLPTVRSHVHHIKQRVGVASRVQLVAYAHKRDTLAGDP